MKIASLRNVFHHHKFEVRGVNHFAHNNDFVTRVLKICRCGHPETMLVPGIWQVEQLAARDVDFDKEFTKAARICAEGIKP